MFPLPFTFFMHDTSPSSCVVDVISMSPLSPCRGYRLYCPSPSLPRLCGSLCSNSSVSCRLLYLVSFSSPSRFSSAIHFPASSPVHDLLSSLLAVHPAPFVPFYRADICYHSDPPALYVTASTYRAGGLVAVVSAITTASLLSMGRG